RHFLLENVKGLLSSRTTLTFDAISDTMSKECVLNIKLNKHTPIAEWITLADNLSVYLRSIGGINGLEKNWKSLLDQTLQITKKQNSFTQELMRPLGLSVDEWATNLKRLSSTDNSQSLDMSILERTMAMSGDVVSWLNR